MRHAACAPKRVTVAVRSRTNSRRVEVRIPFTHATELAFGITLREPRLRPRRGAFRRWMRAFSNSALIVITILVPLFAVTNVSTLSLVGAALFPIPSAPEVSATAVVPGGARPVVEARRRITTLTSAEPPQVRTYVVATGDTLLSVAAQFDIAPQTLAYDNGISDSAQLKVGASLLVPPFNAALHVMKDGETVDAVAARFGLEGSAVRSLNGVAFDDSDAVAGRLLVLPVPDAQYPGFRLHLSDPPRVLAPHVRWPTVGVITQLFSPSHTGVDIAAPYGTPIVATDAGTVSFVGYRGDGGLAVCIYHDWGLETCLYHSSATYVEVGQRVIAGQPVAAIGTTGVTTGPHVHWETRTNGALVDPMTYSTATARAIPGVTTTAP